MRYFGRQRSGVVVVVRGVFHHRNSAHHLDEDDIAAYLDYVVPGHEEKRLSEEVKLRNRLFLPGTTSPSILPQAVKTMSQVCPSCRPSATFTTCFAASSENVYCLTFISRGYAAPGADRPRNANFVKIFTFAPRKFIINVQFSERRSAYEVHLLRMHGQQGHR